MSSELRWGALVTAAGRSSRMGQPKALLTWMGRTLVRHQLETLGQAGILERVLVLGADREAIAATVPPAPGLRIVETPDVEAGRTASIRAGLSAFERPPDALVVVAVDQPLDRESLDLLVRGFDPARFAIGQVEAEGRSRHPVVFAGQLWDDLLAIDEATEGLRAVVRRYERLRQRVPGRMVPAWDLNTPDDYRIARTESGQEAREKGSLTVE